MKVGARILATRKEKGLPQSALICDGVTGAHLSRIENGLREPSVKAIRKIAEKLGVDAVWLETGLRSTTVVFTSPNWLGEELDDVLDPFDYPLEIRVTDLASDDPRLA